MFICCIYVCCESVYMHMLYLRVSLCIFMHVYAHTCGGQRASGAVP